MIRNFYNCDKEVDNNSHGGVGSIDIYRAFRRKDFDGAWDFAIRVIMPPGSSMGEHSHEDDEEMYIILKGESTMINQITRYMLDDISLPFPDKKNYTKIVKELDELDGHIRMLNKTLNIKIDNFKALKSSILQQELLDEVA